MGAKMQQNSNKLVALIVEYASEKTLQNIKEALLRYAISDTSSKYSNNFLNLKYGFILQSN